MNEEEIRKYIDVFKKLNPVIELDDIDLELLVHSLMNSEFAENMLGEYNSYIQYVFEKASLWILRQKKINAVLLLED